MGYRDVWMLVQEASTKRNVSYHCLVALDAGRDVSVCRPPLIETPLVLGQVCFRIDTDSLVFEVLEPFPANIIAAPLCDVDARGRAAGDTGLTRHLIGEKGENEET